MNTENKYQIRNGEMWIGFDPIGWEASAVYGGKRVEIGKSEPRLDSSTTSYNKSQLRVIDWTNEYIAKNPETFDLNNPKPINKTDWFNFLKTKEEGERLKMKIEKFAQQVAEYRARLQ